MGHTVLAILFTSDFELACAVTALSMEPKLDPSESGVQLLQGHAQSSTITTAVWEGHNKGVARRSRC
jgi:hypothetical protein